MRTRAVASVLIIGLVGLAAPSSAQEQPADDAAARRHFEAASRYYAEGAYEDALREFSESYRLSELPGLLYNIGLCHERLGSLGLAADHLERFLAEVPDVEGRAALERRVTNLRERHRRQQADGAAVVAPAGDGGVSPATWVALSVAGAGAITWGIFGVLALTEHGSLQDECATRRCDEDDVASLDAYNLIGDVGFAVTVTAAATAVVLLFVGSASSSEERPEAARVAPWVGPSTAGIGVAGAL